MAAPLPTQIGDVLMLRTDNRTLSIHAVGRVSKDGQRDLDGQTNVTCVRNRAVAIAEATVLLVPGRRIFFWNIDTGEWSGLSN
jgi:hypothetical protein